MPPPCQRMIEAVEPPSRLRPALVSQLIMLLLISIPAPLIVLLLPMVPAVLLQVSWRCPAAAPAQPPHHSQGLALRRRLVPDSSIHLDFDDHLLQPASPSGATHWRNQERIFAHTATKLELTHVSGCSGSPCPGRPRCLIVDVLCWGLCPSRPGSVARPTCAAVGSVSQDWGSNEFLLYHPGVFVQRHSLLTHCLEGRLARSQEAWHLLSSHSMPHCVCQ